MAKQSVDQFTKDAFDAPRRGRPPKPDSLTGAQRQALFRLRHRPALKDQLLSEAQSKIDAVSLLRRNEKSEPCTWCGSEVRGCEACMIGQRG